MAEKKKPKTSKRKAKAVHGPPAPKEPTPPHRRSAATPPTQGNRHSQGLA